MTRKVRDKIRRQVVDTLNQYADGHLNLRSAERILAPVLDEHKLPNEIKDIIFEMDIAVGLSEMRSREEMYEIEINIKKLIKEMPY